MCYPCAVDKQDWQLFLDLDGVLADFDRGVEDLLGRAPHSLEPRRMWPALARSPGFYEHLQWMPDGRLLWEACAPAHPVILTGLPLGKWAEPQKRAWCARELGEDVPVIAGPSKKKHELAAQWLADRGRGSAVMILVDDREKQQEAWEQAGGLFVLHRGARTSLGALESISGFGETLGR